MGAIIVESLEKYNLPLGWGNNKSLKFLTGSVRSVKDRFEKSNYKVIATVIQLEIMKAWKKQWQRERRERDECENWHQDRISLVPAKRKEMKKGEGESTKALRFWAWVLRRVGLPFTWNGEITRKSRDPPLPSLLTTDLLIFQPLTYVLPRSILHARPLQFTDLHVGSDPEASASP